MDHFTSIQTFHDYMHWPPPHHPMFSVIPLGSSRFRHRESSPPITHDFYMITLKVVVAGTMTYGRTRFDFSRGAMLFNAPRQQIQWDDIAIEQKGFVINCHEDFIKGYGLSDRIKTYGYFSYAVNEALHLSAKEETILMSIYENIESEYYNNQDEFSKDIIIGLLDTLLKYADRFYKRQFINRKEITGDLNFQFNQALISYFESGKFTELGIPTIDWVARKLAVSSRYLSDALKSATGKTAMEHLHLYLIDEAKNMLLEPGKTVSEVAYQLGFEYPQYFSRLFKKKVGVSPTMFRDNHMVH